MIMMSHTKIKMNKIITIMMMSHPKIKINQIMINLKKIRRNMNMIIIIKINTINKMNQINNRNNKNKLKIINIKIMIINKLPITLKIQLRTQVLIITKKLLVHLRIIIIQITRMINTLQILAMIMIKISIPLNHLWTIILLNPIMMLHNMDKELILQKLIRMHLCLETKTKVHFFF